MKLRYKIWLETEAGKAFGRGPCELLKRVEKLGSLNRAAGEMNMSYSRAWRLMNNVEKILGRHLLVRQIGGDAGGGSMLTEEGRQLMEEYSAFAEEAEAMLQGLFKKYFGQRFF